MPNKDTEFKKHPAVIFLKKFIASISASISEHSLKDSMYSLTLTTIISAERLKAFLEEKVIQYDYDRTYFLINLDSIPQELLKEVRKNTKESPRDILVNLLRNNGFEPKALSSKKLLGNEIRLHGNSVIRLDFFDKKTTGIMVSIIEKAGFDIKPSRNNDPCCYLVDLEKSNPVSVIKKKGNTANINDPAKISFTLAFIKKLLNDNQLPMISSFGNEKREGYSGKLRGYYFTTTEDRDIVFNFLVKKFPDSEFLSLSERTILINDPNMLTKGTRTKTAKPAIAKVIPIESPAVLSDIDINSEKTTLEPAEIRKVLKEIGLKPKSSNYTEKGRISKINYDTRGYFMRSTTERNTFLEFLKKNFPKVKIGIHGTYGVLIKADKKNKKKFKSSAEKKITSKKVVTVPQVKVSKTLTTKAFTPEIPFFMEEFKELLVRYNILPKVEQPAGVLIPDSIGDEITLPKNVFVGLGKDGLILNTKGLRDYFKKIK